MLPRDKSFHFKETIRTWRHDSPCRALPCGSINRAHMSGLSQVFQDGLDVRRLTQQKREL